jgi:cell filamentation protein
MPIESMDPYVYPGTNVLKNLRDIRDLVGLSKFEMDMTTRRASELLVRPAPGKFDIPHLKSIHGYIFQDVYDWAGEFRSVNIARPGQFYFAFVQQIGSAFAAMLDALRKEQFLSGLGPERFSQRAAYYMGELNAIHPFRDGNRRTQREFVHYVGTAVDSLCSGPESPATKWARRRNEVSKRPTTPDSRT